MSPREEAAGAHLEKITPRATNSSPLHARCMPHKMMASGIVFENRSPVFLGRIDLPFDLYQRSSLFFDVVSVDPAIFLIAVESFEEDVLVVFALHHSDSLCHIRCSARRLLRVGQKSFDRLARNRLPLLRIGRAN